MYKIVITCAITGAEVTREDNPNLPVTPEEIATAACQAHAAGAIATPDEVRQLLQLKG